MEGDSGSGWGVTPQRERFMRAALEQGRQARAVSEVPVGCVFVVDGQIIAAGRNFVNEMKDATRHAELVAIDALTAERGRTEAQALLRRSELYVTCEPCIMCASALAQLGVASICFGCRNDRFGGCGTVLDAYSLSSIAARGANDSEPDQTRCTGDAKVCNETSPATGSSQIQSWESAGCRFVAGLAERESVALLKSNYTAGNPRTESDTTGPVDAL